MHLLIGPCEANGFDAAIDLATLDGESVDEVSLDGPSASG